MTMAINAPLPITAIRLAKNGDLSRGGAVPTVAVSRIISAARALSAK